MLGNQGIISMVVGLLGACGVYAQPSVASSECFGSTGMDNIYAVTPTADGGFILGGLSLGAPVGATCPGGGWVLKFDADGSLNWQQCISGYSQVTAVAQCVDGGFAVAGNSLAGDAFVAKLDAQGGIVWLHFYGGVSNDYLRALIPTSDGGLAFAGWSHSTDGVFSSNHGARDYWIVKLDSVGSMTWQTLIGGSSWDSAYSLIEAPSGNLLVGGTTWSTDGDVVGNHGYYDAWIACLDTTGGIVWQQCYGGSSAEEAKDLAFSTTGELLVCATTSSSDGDLSDGFGLADLWVFAIDALNGGIIWQTRHGSPIADFARYLSVAANGDIWACASRLSNPTNPCGMAGQDVWVVQLDASGNAIGDICIGGDDFDDVGGIVTLTNSDVVLSGWTSSVSGLVATCYDESDAWVVRLEVLSTGISTSDQIETSRNGVVVVDRALDIFMDRPASLTLFDSTGRVVLAQKSLRGSVRLTLDDLTPGCYTVVTQSESSVRSFRIALQ